MPNKLNIRFSVLEKPIDVMEVLYLILLDIIENGRESERYLIFCCTYSAPKLDMELRVFLPFLCV